MTESDKEAEWISKDHWYDLKELKDTKNLLGKEFFFALHRSHVSPNLNLFIKQTVGVSVTEQLERAVQSMRSVVGTTVVVYGKIVAHNLREDEFDKTEAVLREEEDGKPNKTRELATQQEVSEQCGTTESVQAEEEG